MDITAKDIELVRQLMEELMLYRKDDEELREMATDGLYEDEIAFAKKLGIQLDF